MSQSNAAHDSHDHPGEGAALDVRADLHHQVEHFCHMLSEQGPMSITFVHNNTLLGLQKSHFEVAIKEAERFLGGRGYLTSEAYRSYFSKGRITLEGLERALRERKVEGLDDTVVAGNGQSVSKLQVLQAHLVYGIDAMAPADLRFRALERGETQRLREDLSAETRKRLLAAAAKDLAARLEAIGRSRTMSDWLQELTGLDLRRTLLASVNGHLSGSNSFAAAVEPNLRALGIPEAQWRTYFDCIDSHLGPLQGSDSQRAEKREIWLREEVRT